MEKSIELINNQTKVVGICGPAQSGKGVTANYLTCLAWRTHNLIENFELDRYGRIVLHDLKGVKFPQGKIFDPFTFNNDEEVDNILKVCFPHPLNIAQQIAFGDALKESVNIMFGIDSELLWGDDKAKSTETEYTAGQFIDLVGATKFPFKNKKGSDPLTVREILQFWGTDCGRRIDKNIWTKRFTERVYHMIDRWRPMIILCPDVRFQNEQDCIRSMGGMVIGLTRQVKSSAGKVHASEKTNDLISKCDYVIDNQNDDIRSQCVKLFDVYQHIFTNQ